MQSANIFPDSVSHFKRSLNAPNIGQAKEIIESNSA